MLCTVSENIYIYRGIVCDTSRMGLTKHVSSTNTHHNSFRTSSSSSVARSTSICIYYEVMCETEHTPSACIATLFDVCADTHTLVVLTHASRSTFILQLLYRLYGLRSSLSSPPVIFGYSRDQLSLPTYLLGMQTNEGESEGWVPTHSFHMPTTTTTRTISIECVSYIDSCSIRCCCWTHNLVG